MNHMIRTIYLTFLTLILSFYLAHGQSNIIDEVIAVVGDKRILYSEIEQNYQQLKMQGDEVNEGTRCQLFEQLLTQKLFLNQAEIDSLEVTDAQIDNELNQRMQYFISVLGSEQKLEEYFNKSIIEMKQDLYGEIRDQLLTQQMQSKITEGISVTPSDVRTYYKSLPQDSLPYIDAEVEYNQILLYPRSGEQSIIESREKLLGIRERIMNGESFTTMAVLYSEDASTALKGGELGWLSKTDLTNYDPEYAKAAFALKKGTISKIVESALGFHLIQCIDQTESRINTRHILIMPKVSAEEKRKTISLCDSIVRLIRLDSLKFETAASRFSQDEDSKVNGGQVVNLYRGGARWKMEEFNPAESRVIDNLKIGEISDPFETTDNKGKAVFKIIWLKSRTNPHRGNLKDDYNVFKSRALQIEQNRVINEWIEEKIKTTYIRLADVYAQCPFMVKGWTKQ
jgi:peptidyl-prolyl cis-trans isomerase SurA